MSENEIVDKETKSVENKNEQPVSESVQEKATGNIPVLPSLCDCRNKAYNVYDKNDIVYPTNGDVPNTSVGIATVNPETEFKHAKIRAFLNGMKFSVPYLFKFPYDGNFLSILNDQNSSAENCDLSIIDGINIYTELPEAADPESHIFIRKEDMIKVGNNYIYNDHGLYFNFNVSTGKISASITDPIIDEFVVQSVNQGTPVKATIDPNHSYWFIECKTAADSKKATDAINALFATDESRMAFANKAFEINGASSVKYNDIDSAIKADPDFNAAATPEKLQKFVNRLFSVIPYSGLEKLAHAANSGSKIRLSLNADKELDWEGLMQSMFPTFIENLISAVGDEIELDKDGVPVINAVDKKSLGFLGIKEDVIDSIMQTTKASLTMSNNTIAAADEAIETNKTAFYDAQCELTLHVNESDAKEVIEKNWKIVNTTHTAETDIQESKDYKNRQLNNIASFQLLSRYEIKKEMENGDFKNYHSFTAAMFFFSVMKRNGIATTPEDNYGSYNAFVKYTNAKYAKIVKDEPNYFLEKLTNSILINPAAIKESSLSNIFVSILRDTINLKDITDQVGENNSQAAINKIFERAANRYQYMSALSECASGIVMDSSIFLYSMLSFDTENAGKYSEICAKCLAEYQEKGWKLNDSDYDDVYKTSSAIHDILIDDEKCDKIIKLIKVVDGVGLKKAIDEVSKSRNKTASDTMNICGKYVVLSDVGKYLDAISVSKIAIPDEKDPTKITYNEISKSEVKNLIVKLISEVAAKIITMSAIIRLSSDMDSLSDSIGDLKSKDVSSFMASSIGGLVTSIDVIKTHKDDGENKNITATDFDINQFKSIGKDAIAAHISGLEGRKDITDPKENVPESEYVSRLSLARKDLVKDCAVYMKNVLDLTYKFIDYCLDI